MELIIALIVLAIIAVPFIAIAALVNANKALKENAELRKKLNELLYDKSSQAQKNQGPKEQTKPTATEKQSTAPASPEEPTSDEKELDEKAINLKVWLDKKIHRTGEPIKAHFSAHDKDGVGIWGNGHLILIKLSESTLLPKEVISSWPIELNPIEEFNQQLEFNATESGSYRLKFTLKDSNYSCFHDFSVNEATVTATPEPPSIPSEQGTAKISPKPTEPSKINPSVHSSKKEVKETDKRTSKVSGHSSSIMAEPPKTNDSDSIEMKLGTYWFVRIGVILLLTGIATLAWFQRS